MQNKVNKKSQIGIYFLLGLVILIGFGFVSYIKNNKIKEADVQEVSQIPFDIESIGLYTDNCVKDTGKKALIHIGKHGGYYNLKKPYLFDENFKLPYYVEKGLDFSPSVNDIEAEISKYMDANLQSCINNFDEFKKQGFDIKQGKLKSNTIIGLDSVSINVNFPVVTKKGDALISLNDFKTVVDLPLLRIHNISREIVKEQIQNPNSVCISCLYDLGEENNLNVDVVNYENTSSLVFEISYFNVTEDNIIKSPYNFTFAVRLFDVSCENFAGVDDSYFVEQCAEERIRSSTQEIQIQEVPDLQAKVGQLFNYRIIAIGKNLRFEDYTELFDIKQDGNIEFIPTIEQIGNHSIWVNVKDIFERESFVNFNVEVFG
ncbi:hypothetical protein HYX02_01955 [Candidatus Woesearchaeota archaeon]|nr:hypothetical protein [Candidatus Woesearchaeota archaeon]